MIGAQDSAPFTCQCASVMHPADMSESAQEEVKRPGTEKKGAKKTLESVVAKDERKCNRETTD